MNDIDWSKLPSSSPETEWNMTEMFINDSVSMLSRVLSAIKKWEEIAWAEFEEWKKDIQERDEKLLLRMADYEQDPIADEGIMSIYTEYALYGSLAVSIAALVEDQLPRLFHRGTTILKDGSNDKKTKKPHFGDYMYTLEKTFGCKREDVKHYGDHLFVRELANRFKHSGGQSTQEFVADFGKTAGIEREDERIPYNRYCWECYIQQAKELLLDVARRIAESGAKESKS